MGIKVGTKLQQEITNREPEQVISSIEAFKQYRQEHPVKSQEACLLSMIREKAEPNTASQPQDTKPQKQIISTSNQSSKKFISPDKLKQLSNLFHNKDEQ